MERSSLHLVFDEVLDFITAFIDPWLTAAPSPLCFEVSLENGHTVSERLFCLLLYAAVNRREYFQPRFIKVVPVFTTPGQQPPCQQASEVGSESLVLVFDLVIECDRQRLDGIVCCLCDMVVLV